MERYFGIRLKNVAKTTGMISQCLKLNLTNADTKHQQTRKNYLERPQRYGMLRGAKVWLIYMTLRITTLSRRLSITAITNMGRLNNE